MNFQTMEYFIILAEERNFSKAADRLFITQQSLSSHIASIENELNCKLVVRRVPLELTYAGQVFLRYAMRYQDTLLTMRKEFSDISQNQKGVLRIGVSYSRSFIFMPELISAFQKRYPNIEIVLYEDLNLIKQLSDGNLDLIITNAKEYLPKIEFEDFYEDKTVMLVSKELLHNLKIDPEAVSRAISNNNLNPMYPCPFIMNEHGGITSRISLEMFRHSDFVPVRKCELTNINTILALCLRNVGACFVPESMMNSFLSPNNLERLEVFHLPASLNYTIHFAYMKRSYQWSMITEFIRIARENFPQGQKRPYVWS
ncbi:LysR family transcriptional regulator [Enterocloster aldenensis]|uniref:LysR family transcriptional regulator n=1 Tax=Enterocloster aldenensis TaxID=358742 RepID=UPI00402580D5